MKHWIYIPILLLSALALAQNTPTVGNLPDSGPNLPATCTVGQIYYKTTATVGLNQCNTLNTWTAVGGGSGVASVGLSLNAGATCGAAAVTGSPVTTSGTLNINFTGVNGDIVTFNGSNCPSDSGTLLSAMAPLASPSFTGTITSAGNLNFSSAGSPSITSAAVNGDINLTPNGTGGLVFPQGAVGSAAIKFALDTAGAGIYRTAAQSYDITNGTVNMILLSSSFVKLRSTEAFAVSSTTDANGAADICLDRSAANIFRADANSACSDGLGKLQAQAYLTNTNCAVIGTAANPSVASCSAASSGSFSCATNASTATCQVNTTAVTANSEIFIEGRNDATTGTRLGVTCNTGITTALPEISAVVAGTSFTINLGTFSVNPECFSYFIVN